MDPNFYDLMVSDLMSFGFFSWNCEKTQKVFSNMALGPFQVDFREHQSFHFHRFPGTRPHRGRPRHGATKRCRTWRVESAAARAAEDPGGGEAGPGGAQLGAPRHRGPESSTSSHVKEQVKQVKLSKTNRSGAETTLFRLPFLGSLLAPFLGDLGRCRE